MMILRIIIAGLQGFAPYDNPQIAVCVILEGGYSGVASAQYVAKTVFDTYFGY